LGKVSGHNLSKRHKRTLTLSFGAKLRNPQANFSPVVTLPFHKIVNNGGCIFNAVWSLSLKQLSHWQLPENENCKLFVTGDAKNCLG